MHIGFIGLGNMGSPIALRLSTSEHKIFVYDRNPSKLNLFSKKNKAVTCFDDAVSVALNSELVFTCLPGIESVQHTLIGKRGNTGICKELKPGTICVDLSSSDPSLTKKLSKKLAKRNIKFLDAPVSGGVKGATKGSLTVMVGGDVLDFNRVKPIFALFGNQILHVGSVGSGQAAKCLNNLCSAAGLLIVSECVNVAQSFGIEPSLFVDILNASTGKNNSTENKIKQFILSKKFDSGFSLELMEKDLTSAVSLAADQNIVIPLGVKCKDCWSDAAQFLSDQSDHTKIIEWVNSLK